MRQHTYGPVHTNRCVLQCFLYVCAHGNWNKWKKQSKTPLKGYPITVKTEARQPLSLLAARLVGWVTQLWFTCYKLHQKSHGFIFP